MGNPLVYQCGRPQQIKVKGASGKQYTFIKCDPGKHHQCPVTIVDDGDAAGIVGSAQVADCPAHPCIPSIAPKADHDLVFIRCWDECNNKGMANRWKGAQVGHTRWFQCLKEERAKLN